MARVSRRGLLVAALAAWLGCHRGRDAPPAGDAPYENERRAKVAEALAAVERSSGQARLDARYRFWDFRERIEVTGRDVALLPRFEALLRSADEGDVDLGVQLVGRVGSPSSLGKLWPVTRHPTALVRGRALSTIARVYRDPKLLPVLREAIARDPDVQADAIRALGPLASEPGVADYLRALLADPKHVMLAEEVLKSAGLPFDPAKKAIAQRSYSNWGDGIAIDFPDDWPLETRDGYRAIFHHRAQDAFYGYRIVPLGGAKRAAEVLSRQERRLRVRNRLAEAARVLPADRWQPTGARDAAQAEYLITGAGGQVVRRVVALIDGDHAVIVEGEAAAEHAEVLVLVFERMWPTVRLSAPSPELSAKVAAALTQPQATIDLGGRLPEPDAGTSAERP